MRRTSACTAKALVDALRATPESLVDVAPLWAHADEIEQLLRNLHLKKIAAIIDDVAAARKERS